MASARRTKKNPGDITGRKAQKLSEAVQKQKADEAKAAKEASQEDAASRSEVVDLTGPVPKPAAEPEFVEMDGTPEPEPDADPLIDALVEDADQPAPQEVGGIVRPDGPTVVQSDTIKIRARYDMENVTVGAATLYSFEEDRKYVVPRNVGEHLARKELVDILG